MNSKENFGFGSATLVLTGFFLLLGLTTNIATGTPGTCSDSPVNGCAGVVSGIECTPLNFPGCSYQASGGGSCIGATGSYQCIDSTTNNYASCTSGPYCHTAVWFCSGGGDCCTGASLSQCQAPGFCGVHPCQWSGAWSCTGTFTGSCSDYNNQQARCEWLGCVYTPTYTSCEGDTCVSSADCCTQAPDCDYPFSDVICDANIDCTEIQPGATCNLATHRCILHKVCKLGGPTCQSASDPCTGTGQGNCCSGLRCFGTCEPNRLPAQPGTPQIAPLTILATGTANCVLNCPPPTLPPDPDGDPVTMSYQWYLNGAQTGAWSAATSLGCTAAGCLVGDAINMRTRACDNLNACTESEYSNTITVVSAPPPIGGGTPDLRYIILALAAGFAALALAYMATYLFDVVIK